MKALIFFTVYFCIASAMAAIIALPLFELIGNDDFKFERWVTRSALLFLVLGLIPCLKFFNLSLRSLGHHLGTNSYFKQLSSGFVIGFFILAVVIYVLILLNVRVISPTDQLSLSLCLKALFAGLVVALIEETLFRGLFFKLAKLWHSSLAAVLLSSFFYAILHFIKPIEHIDQSALSLFSGFEVILNAFAALSNMQIDDFFALFSVGILLALVRLKTRSLSYCIGLHASWVFVIKISKELTDSNQLSDWSFLTGQYDGIIGLLSLVWLLILSTTFYLIAIKPSSSNSPS